MIGFNGLGIGDFRNLDGAGRIACAYTTKNSTPCASTDCVVSEPILHWRHWLRDLEDPTLFYEPRHCWRQRFCRKLILKLLAHSQRLPPMVHHGTGL